MFAAPPDKSVFNFGVVVEVIHVILDLRLPTRDFASTVLEIAKHKPKIIVFVRRPGAALPASGSRLPIQ